MYPSVTLKIQYYFLFLLNRGQKKKKIDFIKVKKHAAFHMVISKKKIKKNYIRNYIVRIILFFVTNYN